MNAQTDLDAPHGGPDARGAALHDFSTNANACGPCPMALRAVQQADASRYPDPRYTGLRDSLGAWHGVAPGRIVIAASASEFISRITATVVQRRGGAVWLPQHGYGDYARAAAAWRLGLRREPEAVDGCSLVWCCDPSSPLGQVQPDLSARVDAADPGTCVLDLAYEPLRLEGHLSLDEAQRDRVWQLWTPNKALGLTGIRAAYAVAPHGADDVAAHLDHLAPSWPLGTHGVALLDAWTHRDTQTWLSDSLDRLREWKRRQQALCESLGWAVLPSVANFFCARPDAPHASRAAGLRNAGIQLRDTASFGLPGHVRLGVLPPASQEALARAWRATA
ncbi:aminotransferase class I/II-fold pyridoxal phosphate-dependent enzyme [Variovorax sp. KK3]|uniref:aminotransferase class I/II-fold pyridoxal phosphate-dependent enzyme n=1 Tax=Variovorax sp. KK3 TaxID=1855728 RepID=UPI001180D800|nr:aminotransferase class I/II-fold pyridoxal phosphate-dependent enzyme [Variovorax sp. KK3]